MRVLIKGDEVIFDDETGNRITIRTNQLVEMIRLLKVCSNQDGRIIFETLEFIV